MAPARGGVVVGGVEEFGLVERYVCVKGRGEVL
jgi:hypothetical protein